MSSKTSEELTRTDRMMLIGSLVAIAVGVTCVVAFGVLNPVHSQAGWTSRFFRPFPEQSEASRMVNMGLCGSLTFYLTGRVRTSFIGLFLVLATGVFLIEALFFVFNFAPDWFNFGLCLTISGSMLLLFVPIQRLDRSRLLASQANDAAKPTPPTEARDA